eukprot:71609-Prymnesium_polylepis.1
MTQRKGGTEGGGEACAPIEWMRWPRWDQTDEAAGPAKGFDVSLYPDPECSQMQDRILRWNVTHAPGCGSDLM